MTVVFHHDAAARGVHHKVGHALFYPRPPSIDIGFDLRVSAMRIVQVMCKRATALSFGRHDGLNAEGIQHPRGGRIDVGHHGLLYAPF